jgi:protein-tyrosine-phosphatase
VIRRVLFVCTGNICRSPLAEALFRRVAQNRGLPIDAASAGTGAWEGAPASEGALLIGLEHDLDLSAHRARLLSRELLEQADLVLTMARHHRARVDELGGTGRTFVLGEYAGRPPAEAEVSDPFGGDLDVYRETYAELAALIDDVVARLTADADDADRG